MQTSSVPNAKRVPSSGPLTAMNSASIDWKFSRRVKSPVNRSVHAHEPRGSRRGAEGIETAHGPRRLSITCPYLRRFFYPQNVWPAGCFFPGIANKFSPKEGKTMKSTRSEEHTSELQSRL